MDKALEAGRPPRELLWNEYCDEQGQPDRWDAETPFNTYYGIALLHDGYSVQHDYADVAKALPSLNGAKAAAVADCLRRCSLYLAALPAADTSGLVERLRGEAQMWKMEAMAHKSSLHEAYQACSGATGEPGNWNGAEPIKATIASLTARAEKAEARLAEAEAVIRAGLVVISPERGWGTYPRMEGSEIYDDGQVFSEAARSYLEGRK